MSCLIAKSCCLVLPSLPAIAAGCPWQATANFQYRYLLDFCIMYPRLSYQSAHKSAINCNEIAASLVGCQCKLRWPFISPPSNLYVSCFYCHWDSGKWCKFYLISRCIFRSLNFSSTEFNPGRFYWLWLFKILPDGLVYFCWFPVLIPWLVTYI